MSNFFYDIILEKCFFEIIKGKLDEPLRVLEKILISNILDVKRKLNESKQ